MVFDINVIGWLSVFLFVDYNMGLMWSLFLSEHLYLSGIW